MKVLNELFKYFFSFVLALAVLSLLICSILNSSVLKKEYFISALEKTDYYQKVYDLAYENFSIYVMQSGFESSVFDGIISINKVKEDTNNIFSSIYDNRDYPVDTDIIKANLRDNINKHLQDSGVKAEEKSLKKFENVIVEQYIYSVNYHTSVIKELANGLAKVRDIINSVDIAAKLALAVSLFMIILLNIKNIRVIINSIGVSALFIGVLSILFKSFINQFFDFDVLLVINKALTDLLEYILNSLYIQLQVYGIAFLLIGLCLILLGSYSQAKQGKKVSNNEK